MYPACCFFFLCCCFLVPLSLKINFRINITMYTKSYLNIYFWNSFAFLISTFDMIIGYLDALFWKCLLKSFAHFSVELSAFLNLFVGHLFSVMSPCWIHELQEPSNLWLAFSLLKSIFWWIDILNKCSQIYPLFVCL